MDLVVQRQASTARRLGEAFSIGLVARMEWRLPFFEVHDRRALVLEDGLVGVDADVELIAELAGLDDGARVAWAWSVW